MIDFITCVGGFQSISAEKLKFNLDNWKGFNTLKISRKVFLELFSRIQRWKRIQTSWFINFFWSQWSRSRNNWKFLLIFPFIDNRCSLLMAMRVRMKISKSMSSRLDYFTIDTAQQKRVVNKSQWSKFEERKSINQKCENWHSFGNPHLPEATNRMDVEKMSSMDGTENQLSSLST